MKRKIGLVEKAELAARTTIKEWIRRTLRESFLQALRQTWNIRHNNQASMDYRDSPTSSQAEIGEGRRDGNKVQVELSISGVNACFLFVERLSRAWQTKLKEEQHERVAWWVAEVYQQGKPSLWTELWVNENDAGDIREHLNTVSDIEQPLNQQDTESLSAFSTEKDGITQQADKLFDETISAPIKSTDEGYDNDQEEEASSNSVEDCYDHHDHPNVYCKLRALGRRRKIDSPVLSVPDALYKIKEFTQNHSTYWPLDNEIIDQACMDMSRRMRARDKHGSGGSGNAGEGGKSYKKKTVRFKVLPKSVWETKQQQERNQRDGNISNGLLPGGGQSSERNARQIAASSTQGVNQELSVETVLLASMKRKKESRRSQVTLQATRKKSHISEWREIPRVPFDVPQSSGGRIRVDLSVEDKNMLDGLLILDDQDRDANESRPVSASIPEVTLALFGGLQHVGQINHFVQNPGIGGVRTFMARETDKITRRKEKSSSQERLDPNRLQIGRADNPLKRKSKILRTEDWFDDQKKFFDFDLGWCLLEITIQGNKKRLCAFSSMEICLDDSETKEKIVCV